MADRSGYGGDQVGEDYGSGLQQGGGKQTDDSYGTDGGYGQQQQPSRVDQSSYGGGQKDDSLGTGGGGYGDQQQDSGYGDQQQDSGFGGQQRDSGYGGQKTGGGTDSYDTPSTDFESGGDQGLQGGTDATDPSYGGGSTGTDYSGGDGISSGKSKKDTIKDTLKGVIGKGGNKNSDDLASSDDVDSGTGETKKKHHFF